MSRSIVVHAAWDAEAHVWVATSNDVPGLATEAETREELLRKLQDIIPELLELNRVDFDGDVTEVPLWVMSEELSKVRVRSSP